VQGFVIRVYFDNEKTVGVGMNRPLQDTTLPGYRMAICQYRNDS
jgi:hypothetical protein